ncbi:MAG: beta-hydroxyacyl-ACP dehydratase [Planctomycetota bacterium]|jgi:3-hydroxyacyl-[acyl-carrier-protein] dehydratase|nr:beta-hydroxyacyl-ACP dehydratase [Planctomycetota bacterium]
MAVDIKAAIPHRDPFLLLDDILELSPDRVKAKVTLRPDHPLWKQVYSGHYPGNPITPGVLLLEIMFQAAGVLLAGQGAAGVPVVTRVREVKFRRLVRPGDCLEVEAVLKEKLANAFYLAGKAWVGGEVACQAEFTLALVAEERQL